MSIQLLFDKDTINQRIEQLGKQITKDYENQSLTIISVLKGSLIFCADLIRHIQVPLQLEYLGVQSYGTSTKTSGIVQITHDLQRSIEGQHIIIVEDIIDTGLTITYLLETLQARKPKSIKVASLLLKPSQLKTPISIDYLGFKIDDVFVVGYGLDYAEQYRNLPFIGILEQDT